MMIDDRLRNFNLDYLVLLLLYYQGILGGLHTIDLIEALKIDENVLKKHRQAFKKQ